MKFNLNNILIVVLLAFFLCSSAVMAKESSKVKSSFENTGVDDAFASVKASFKESKSKLSIKIKGLDDSKTYYLNVDGIEEEEFTTKKGKAKLSFIYPSSGKLPPLDFDPRGKEISIDDGSSIVLETMFNGEGDAEGSKVREETSLIATDLALGGKGKAEFKKSKGRSAFKVEIEDVSPGNCELYVDGIMQGIITVTNRGRGKIKFDTKISSTKTLLGFDPRNNSIDVICGGEVYFTSTMIAKIGGINSCEFSETVKVLFSTGEDPDASAEAEFKTKEDCDLEFEVEVEDLPVGVYELFVDEVFRGNISVVDAIEGYGEIEFSTDFDEEGKLPLDFDPQDKMITIQQGDVVFFSDTTSGGTTVISTCDSIENEVSFFNSGEIVSAKGKMRFRQDSDCDQDFRVEIENLPFGDYKLIVGGAEKGTISVIFVDGELEGEIEFDKEPDPDEELLDFDPRGQLVEVNTLDGTTLLSRVLDN